MKPYRHKDIFGNWATLLLATDKDGNIDYGRLADEIDILTASYPNGIYSNGTAGEFYTLSEEEFDKTSLLLAEKCESSKIPFQIGVCHTSPQASLERLKRIKELRPCAVQLTLPDWFPPVFEEVISFLVRMEEMADGISLILYNPPHAKKQLEPEDWSELKSKIPTLEGLKVFDQNANPEWYARLRGNCSELSIFIPGHRLATGIKNGAHGSYSNMACLNPFAAQKWHDLISEDIDAGLELEQRIGIFMEQYIHPLIIEHQYSNQACDRFLAILGGWADVGNKLRWPYRSVPVEYVKQIKSPAINLIPEFFRIRS